MSAIEMSNMIVASHYTPVAKLGASMNSEVFSARIRVSDLVEEQQLVKIKQFNPLKFFKSRAIAFADETKSEKELLESLPQKQVQKVRELFQESGSRLVNLQHPNLTAVLGVYLPDDSIRFGVVMEHFKGETLHKLLQTEDGRLMLSNIPLKTRLLWIRQIAEALQFLHENGILHHNLHNSNLIIDLETQTVKITDFFSECFMKPTDAEDGENEDEEDEEEEEDEDEQEDEEEKARKEAMERMLNLSKMADFETPPELHLRVGFNKASDVYCFTILQWQILCCEIPFSGVEDRFSLKLQMIKQHLRPSLDTMTSFLPAIEARSKFLERVAQGWVFTPSKRATLQDYTQSIDEMLREM